MTTLLVCAVIVIVLAVIVATRPDEFRVTRSTTIAAPPEAVFEQVNNLHNWQMWSPWAKLDPTAQNAYDGPLDGAGAGFSWAGNSQVGEGHMTITESRPHELIRFQLDFVKPFKGTNTTEFTFKPEGNQTRITWTMSGKNSFMSKAIGLVMNCEKMVGGQFEQGFANLKAVVETSGGQ